MQTPTALLRASTLPACAKEMRRLLCAAHTLLRLARDPVLPEALDPILQRGKAFESRCIASLVASLAPGEHAFDNVTLRSG